MKILVGNSIAQNLKQQFSDKTDLSSSIGRFPSTEAFSEVLGQIKDQPIVVMQSLAAVADHTANDFAMQLLLTVRTLKRYGSGPIWVIMPFAGYSRQDRSRENHMDSVACDDFAFFLRQAGVVGVSTVEMHSQKGLDLIKNHFDGNAYTIDPTELYHNHLANQNLIDPVVGGPDHGAHERAQNMAQQLNAEQFHVQKHRDEVAVSKTKLIAFDGEVSGHDAVIVDDMIDTGGTAQNCALRLKEEGAPHVLMCAAHFIGSNHAAERLLNAKTPSNAPVFDQIIVTNSIDLEPELQRLERQYPGVRRRISVLSIGSLLREHTEKIILPHPAMRHQPV